MTGRIRQERGIRHGDEWPEVELCSNRGWDMITTIFTFFFFKGALLH